MKKVLILTVMLTGVLALGFAQTALSGTYRYSANAYITFTGSNFTGSWNRTDTMSGTFSISGNRLTLNITGGTKARNTWTWTIVDANTLRDQDGDSWRKEGGKVQAVAPQSALSGIYRYDASHYITFTGSNFTGSWGGDAMTGTFSVSESRLTINRTNGETWNWTIVDANTFRDHDGDSWMKDIADSAMSEFFGIWVWSSLKITIFNGNDLKIEMLTNSWDSGSQILYFNYQIDSWTVSTPPQQLAEAGYTKGYKLSGKVVSNGGYWPWINHQINATPSMYIYIHSNGQSLAYSGDNNTYNGWFFTKQ